MFSQLAIDKISRIVFVEGERGILKKIYIREIIKTRKKILLIFLVLLLLITLLIICVNPFYKVLVPLSLLEYASLFNREPQLNTINLVLKMEGKLAISDDCPVAIQTYIFPFLLNLLSKLIY